MNNAWHRLRSRRAHLGLVALCVLAYAPPILGLLCGWWPFGEDALAYFAPVRGWVAGQLRGGTVPLWNPYLFCGQPLAANLQTALWYPPNLIYWLLPERLAVVLDALGHTIWLAWGGYALARALRLGRGSSFLAAALLALGGATAARVYAGQLIWLAAFAQIPWLLRAELGYLRSGRPREALVAGAWMALLIVAGHPPTALLAALLSCALVGLWSATRERGAARLPRGWGGAFGGFAAMALLLSAVAWLPFRELSNLAEHGGALGYNDATILSATWKSFVRLVAPEWFGGNRGLQWSTTCCSHEEVASLGVWPFVLAVASLGLTAGAAARDPRTRAVRWVWLALPLVAFVALGAHTPLYGWLYQMLPPLRVVRIPARWLLIWAFAAPFLAALVWKRAFEERDEKTVRLATLLLQAVVAVFMVAAAWALLSPESVWMAAAGPAGASTPGLKGGEIAANFRRVALLESGTVVLLAGLAGSLVQRWRGAANPVAQCRLARVLIGFACLECLLGFWRGAKLVSPRDQADAFWPPAIAARHEAGERWATSIFWQGMNRAMTEGVPLVNGYDPLGTKMYFAYASAAEGHKFWETLYQPKRHSPLWQVAGVTHTLAQKRDPLDGETPYPDTRGWTLEAESGRWELWDQRQAAWPRTYLASEVWKSAEPLALLGKLAARRGPSSGEVSFGGAPFPVVVSPESLPGLPVRIAIGTVPEAPGVARILHETPDRVTLSAVAARPSALVLADAGFPGWKAYVNGRAKPVAVANGLFRAVEVPRGTSRIEMVFEPQTVRLGWFVTLCGLVALSYMMQVRPPAAPPEKNDESDPHP